MLDYTTEADIAHLAMDDGKANALGPAMLDALEAGLQRARNESRAIVLHGRKGRFCAGFDLRVMASGPDAAVDLVRRGADVFLQLLEHPRPVVASCGGHAVAGGAVLLLCCDVRIGADEPIQIGLNEVRIGMPLPEFVALLGQERLDPRRRFEALLGATLYDPEGAVKVGFLDEVCAEGELRMRAQKRAAALAAFPPGAFASSKGCLRAPVAERIREGIDADLRRVRSHITMQA